MASASAPCFLATTEPTKPTVSDLQRLLETRVHIVSGSLAVSPGHVTEQFATPAAALAATRPWLRRLPDPLLALWLAAPGGDVILNAGLHGFVPGDSAYQGRTLLDVAWLKLAVYADDPVAFLTPLGHLIAHLLGWGSGLSSYSGTQAQPALDAPAPVLRAWDQFVNGVQSCFRAGYGLSTAAQTDVTAYLAEGIAAYLDDRRRLNVRDPRLHKLLASTVFRETSYSARTGLPHREQ